MAAQREQSTKKELDAAKQQLADMMKRLAQVEAKAINEAKDRDALINKAERELLNEK